jgi:hypothetical protein
VQSRTFRYLLDVIVFICTISPAQFAISGTVAATAIVKVTVLAPSSAHDSGLSPGHGDLMLSSLQIDMRGKVSNEITVFNNSDISREIMVAITPHPESATECQIYYSPIQASIPPRSVQVVRLLIKKKNAEACPMEHRLTISDLRAPLSPLFDVPVYTEQF